MPHTVLIHYSSYPKHPSELDYSSKKTQTIDVKRWKWLRVQVIACGVSWTKLERPWNLQVWSTKKPHSLRVPFFCVGICKRCYPLLGNHTSGELQFFHNFQDKHRNLSGVFAETFPQPSCLIFFGNRPRTDRQTDLFFCVLRYCSHCAGLKLLPEPPQNKISYRLHPKNTPFSCLPTIYSSSVWKSTK